MNKIIIVVLTIIFITSSLNFSDENIDLNDIHGFVETSVKINDQFLYADTSHILIEDTVFVVGRFLVEALGGKIEWVEESQTVKMLLDDRSIEIVIGDSKGLVDGQVVDVYKAPFLKDGRTMIPLRFVSENFGCLVTWKQETYTVDIKKEGIILADDYSFNRPYTDEELYLLSKIVTVESGDKSLEMALAIANTVLNRVEDERFPNSIEDVIYEVNSHVQFPPAHKDSFETLEAKHISTIAAKKALEGINIIENSLFFNNRPFKSKADDLIRIIDGEYFYE